MVPLKFALFTMFILVVFTNQINCNDEQKKKQEVNEDKTVDEEDSKEEQTPGGGSDDVKEINEDEIGEKFLSLLSDELRFKILKNKAANEGLLDKDKFKREPLTKKELNEVQAALAKAMEPLFGQFVKELAIDEKDIVPDKEEPALELDPPKVDLNQQNKSKQAQQKQQQQQQQKEPRKSDKKSTTSTDDKKKPKTDESVKKDTATKKETQKDKTKKDSEKGKKKTGKAKDEKKDKKQKEEL